MPSQIFRYVRPYGHEEKLRMQEDKFDTTRQQSIAACEVKAALEEKQKGKDWGKAVGARLEARGSAEQACYNTK